MKDFEKFCRKFREEVIPDRRKTVIIGGYDLGGAYCNWLLKKTTGSPAEIIIDDSLCVYGVKVYRELALQLLDPAECICIVPSDKRYAEMFARNGFDYILLEEKFGCERFGFYEWLEAEYGVDLAKTIAKETFDYDFRFATNSGASRQMGLVDVICYIEERLFLDIRDKRVLDIGCGKGGAMELFSQSEFAKVDGIEYSKSISEIARKNMKLLGNDSDVFNLSATEYDRYDDYDILYMYDPFRGEVFREVLKKLEQAAIKRNKPTLLVYANPYHHKDIVEGGVFSLVSIVDTDFFHRDVHIYSSKEVK